MHCHVWTLHYNCTTCLPHVLSFYTRALVYIPHHGQLQDILYEMACEALGSMQLCWLQVVQFTQQPIQTTSLTEDVGFSNPSMVICSFGSYNLSSLEMDHDNLYGGRWQVNHTYADLLTTALSNYTISRNQTPESTAYPNDAYGINDLITFTTNLNGSVTDNPPGYATNFSTPQLLGLIRAAAITQPDPFEEHYGFTATRWCVMRTSYRLTLDNPPATSCKQPELDTGTDEHRQLSARQISRFAMNFRGTALLQSQARQWPSFSVHQGDANSENLETNASFPPVVSVQFVDFPGSRKNEWQHDSPSSKYLSNVLSSGEPDGFTLVSLNRHNLLTVQKQITTSMSRAQKFGWFWPAWPWSSDSTHQVRLSIPPHHLSVQLCCSRYEHERLNGCDICSPGQSFEYASSCCSCCMPKQVIASPLPSDASQPLWYGLGR